MPDLSALRASPLPPSNRSCGLRATLDIVAGKWKPLVLWHLLAGPQRYAALRRNVGEVSDKVLQAQLKELEADGVLLRRVLSGQPLAVEYGLSPLGETLAPLLAAMSRWGFEHIVPAGAPDPAGSQADGA